MDLKEAIKERHAVRSFEDKSIDESAVAELQKEIDACNRESGLHIQLILDEPNAFQAEKPSYGAFKGCKNYLVIVGPKGKDVEAGYYGEKIVLKAQTLGINSCWVAMTYKKGSAKGEIYTGEKRYIVVALGYGTTQGIPHKSKSISDLGGYEYKDPDWYKEGLEAAALAPTAMNQQKFKFELHGDKVKAKPGIGFYTQIDLGIAKCHFEIGSGKDSSVWIN